MLQTLHSFLPSNLHSHFTHSTICSSHVVCRPPDTPQTCIHTSLILLPICSRSVLCLPPNHPHSVQTLAHGKLLQSPLQMPNSVTSFGPCQMWLSRSRNKSLSTGRIHTGKHTKRFSHTGPATCPLCGGSDRAPHILLRCNNHTLKRMHINRHHHAVSLCGEEISKGKLGSWLGFPNTTKPSK
jgi:hypothetical protein